MAVKVGGSENGPGGGNISNPRRTGIQDGGAVHFPDCDVAACIAPEDVPSAIAIEVAGSDDGPGGGNISNPRRIGIQDGGALHFPDCAVAAGIAPGDVP